MTTATAGQNTAIAKRLRDMLLRQREKFQKYLQLLEQEELSIENGDTARLQVHLEMEKGLIAEIHTLRKVIDPLEEMYKAAYPRSEETVPPLKEALEKMGAQIKERNARNRAALETRMNRLAQEISGLRMWPHANASFPETVPAIVDIRT
jgi:flagellar biosynthesis/type III secretory pathway chaperone